MKINIICVGKLKEDYLADGIKEYLKRLSRFATVSIIELPDEKIPDNASDSVCEKIKETEGKKILARIGKDDYIISLCVEGKQMQSEEFASSVSDVLLSGKSTISFIIGGSLGLSDEVKKISNLRLSFSKMTFPHQLMRLVLLEQVYRAFKINANEQYHK